MKAKPIMKDYTPNPLSLVPGGVTVELTYANGVKALHERVKYPKKYVEKVLSIEGSNLLSAVDTTRGVTIYHREKNSPQQSIEF